MTTEPEKKKRKMEPHVSGDDLTQDAGHVGGILSSKSLQKAPSGSPSGDFSNSGSHQYVTFVSSGEEEPTQGSSGFEVCKQGCEMGDAWLHKYPLPLSQFPMRPIRTGNFYYDGIISDLELIGYKPLQVIAKGRSGTIILAQDLHKRRMYSECECIPIALKLNSGKSKRKIRSTLRADMLEEMNIHRQLVHPNIIAWLNNINYQGRIGTVTEFCENGTLEQLVKMQEARFLTERVSRKYFQQIFGAIEYMHHQGFAHRDICLQNVLLNTHNVVKLADFGHAVRFISGDPLCDDECGSLGYQAPEMLCPVPYNPKLSDIWALGALLYSMTTGKLPFGLLKGELLEQSSKKVNFPEDRVLPLSAELKELLRGLLGNAPASRFSLNRIRQSPWMNKHEERVQIGNFYMIRQPQKTTEGMGEKAAKEDMQI